MFTATLDGEIEKTCAICGRLMIVPVSIEGYNSFFSKKNFRLICTGCSDQRDMTDNSTDEAHIELIATWIPLTYRQSRRDIILRKSKLTEQQILDIIGWQPNPVGILLTGPPQTCKSRIAYALLIKLIKSGYKIRAYDPLQWRSRVESKIRERSLALWLDDLIKLPDMVYIDDLGKFYGAAKRIEEELFNLIKGRIDNQKGMMFTTNIEPAGLRERFSEAIAEPLIRRIKENCTLYKAGNGGDQTQQPLGING